MKQASGRCSESAMLRIEIGRDASKGPGMGNSVNALPAGAQGVSDHRMGVVGGDWKAHQRARCMVTGYLTRLLYRHAEVQAGGGLIVCLLSLNLPSFHVLLT